MAEQAGFEARAILAPSRARRTRLALLVPVVALVVTAWAGLSGRRGDEAIADVPLPSSVVASPPTVEGTAPAPRTPIPAQVVGLDVERLQDVLPRQLGREDVVAVSGWYRTTAISNCPFIPAISRPGALPYVRGDADPLAFCERDGVLYAGRPDLVDRLPRNNLEDNRSKNAGLPAVAVAVAIGVVVPLELEEIAGDAKEVVFVGRFIGSTAGCRTPAPCPRTFVVDHVGWTPGA